MALVLLEKVGSQKLEESRDMDRQLTCISKSLVEKVSRVPLQSETWLNTALLLE